VEAVLQEEEAKAERVDAEVIVGEEEVEKRVYQLILSLNRAVSRWFRWKRR
jgi:hypothetical protein